jgi:hypothetical protein
MLGSRPSAASGSGEPSSDKDSITVEFLDAFNRQRSDIERSIEAVELGTKQVNSLCEQVKTAFNSEDIDRLSKQLADVVKSAQRDAAKGKSLLDALKRDGEALVKTNPRSERVQAYKAQYQRLCKCVSAAPRVRGRRRGRRPGPTFPPSPYARFLTLRAPGCTWTPSRSTRRLRR